MTSTTDTAEHPDVTEISDLTEGILPPARTADVRRHLDACELCADVHASLEEIRGLLGTLPGSTHMPSDVAERIDAALAAEALLMASAIAGDTPAGAATGSAPAETVTPSSAETAASRPTAPFAAQSASETLAAAESAVDVSRETSTPAGAPGTPADRPAGHPRASRGPGRSHRKPPRRRRTVVLGAVFTAAAIGLGSLLVQSLGGGDTNGASEKPSQQTTGNARAFSEDTLQGRVADLLNKNSATEKRGSSKPSFDVKSSPDSPRNEDRQPPLLGQTYLNVPVPECIQEGIGRADQPLAAEQGTYEGTPVYLVVLPHESDAKQVSAYIVDAACTKQRTATAGKVLLSHSYARG